MRGVTEGENAHFHLLLQNQLVDFNQTWWGSSLEGRDQKLFIQSMWPPGVPRGRVPQGEIGQIYVPNHKSLQSRYVVVDIFIDEEYKLFMAKPGAKVLCMFWGGSS